jgi:hypothetical protein
MPAPSVDPRPPLFDESRLVMPLEAQNASYLAASERIANRSSRDFFIRMFTICSITKGQSCALPAHVFQVWREKSQQVTDPLIRIFWKSAAPICYKLSS